MSKQWVNQAIAKIEADFQRSADTHLIKLDLPQLSGIDIYLKDESTHPTGSLKHRLARSLFFICAFKRVGKREHHHNRIFIRQHRCVRSLFFKIIRLTIYCRYAFFNCKNQD